MKLPVHFTAQHIQKIAAISSNLVKIAILIRIAQKIPILTYDMFMHAFLRWVLRIV